MCDDVCYGLSWSSSVAGYTLACLTWTVTSLFDKTHLNGTMPPGDRAGTYRSEEIELVILCTVQQRELLGFCLSWIRALPAKASEVSIALEIEDHALLPEALLLVASCTDRALRVDHTLPGNKWL